ncbi:hypothetical protein K2X05_03065 [bacterium]|nr:hypothetical protein [bacterium]
MLNQENNIDLIISLLEEKNHHLQMFLEVSINERKSFKARNFENLEELYSMRESLLEGIRSIDRRLHQYSVDIDTAQLSIDTKDKIKTLMAAKQNLVNQILSQDLVMLSCVENEKSNMIKKMTSVRDGRRLLKAYRFMPDIID